MRQAACVVPGVGVSSPCSNFLSPAGAPAKAARGRRFFGSRPGITILLDSGGFGPCRISSFASLWPALAANNGRGLCVEEVLRPLEALFGEEQCVPGKRYLACDLVVCHVDRVQRDAEASVFRGVLVRGKRPWCDREGGKSSDLHRVFLEYSRILRLRSW